MAILKCKMCGGDLEIIEGMTVCECEYCGTKQTAPLVDNEKKLTLFTRANRLRYNCEFDKAFNIYESIVAEFPEEAEAYWGLVLCKYGIEYVDDPATGKKVPTCHRSSFDSVLEDSNFEMVMEYSDSLSRSVYRGEARAIEDIRTGILEISSKEEPYDIFICYKETDINGERTLDSVLSQDVYDALVEKGYKVFFSRITLEDKLGQEYEPYIFAALNSAKVMLVFGTDYEYFNAVWVKNEWSRYLALIAKGDKKTLIPCYKDIDAYDMPKEFKRLQAQDMGKVGAVQDLLRGIDKILGIGTKSEAQPMGQQVIQSTTGVSSSSLTKRAQLFLEEHNWEKVLEYCEKILDSNPESGEAYWIKEMAERQCETVDDLISFYFINSARESKTLSYARRFADQTTRESLDYFDNGLKNAENIQQKRNEEKKLARKNDSSLQKLKKEIEQSRHWMKLLEDKVIVSYYQTLAVTSDGKVVATEVTYDEYGFYNRYTDATKWTGITKLYEDDDKDVIIGLKANGSLLFTKDREGNVPGWIQESKMSKWTGIEQLYQGDYGWYGLTRMGTVLFAKHEKKIHFEGRHGQDNVSGLKDIKKIVSEFKGRIICLKKDGTLCATEFTNGKDESPWDEMSKWTDIEDVCFSVPGRIVGIKTDRTLIATKYEIESSIYSQGGDDKWSEISSWVDVVKIGRLHNRVIALDAYGELLVTKKFQPDKESDKEKHDPWEKISSWNGLIDFYLDEDMRCDYAFGIRYDGLLLSEKWYVEYGDEEYDYGQADVDCVNVVKCFADVGRTVCVKRDGSVLAIGDDGDIHGANDVYSFKLFDDIESFEKDEEERSKKAAYEMYVAEINSQIETEIAQAVDLIKTKYGALKQPVLSEMKQAMDANLQKKRDLVENRVNLERRRTNLGLFKGKEKADITNQISDIDSQLERLETDQMIRDSYQLKIVELNNQESAEIKKISEEIKLKHTFVSIDEFQA